MATTCCAWRTRPADASGSSSGRCSLSSSGGLAGVRARIAAACARAGRDPDEVTLVAVTKGHSPDEVRRVLLDAGHTVLGENRIQEWRPKHEALGDAVSWHLVGHLQRNKVRSCRPFALLHAVDSLRLGEALSEQGEKWEHTFRVLVQVNVAREATKFGVSTDEAAELVERLASLPSVRVDGLMTMAPYADDPEEAREVFAGLAGLRATLGLRELSMGMSADLDVAVEEGATIVRVGTALFEAPDARAAPHPGR